LKTTKLQWKICNNNLDYEDKVEELQTWEALFPISDSGIIQLSLIFQITKRNNSKYMIFIYGKSNLINKFLIHKGKGYNTLEIAKTESSKILKEFLNNIENT